MRKSSGKILLKYIIYAVELIFVYVLEHFLNVRMGFGGLYIFMTIPTFVSIVLFERENSGMIFGIISGMLIDYGHGNGIGGVAIFLCIFGYMMGMVANYILCANIFVGVAVSTFLIMVVEGMKIFCMLGDINLWSGYFCEYFWKDLIVAVPVFIIMFYLNRVVSYRFGREERVFN